MSKGQVVLVARQIKVECEIRPKFLVIDDGHEDGMRVIYYSKIENITCKDSDFRPDKFKIKPLYQA